MNTILWSRAPRLQNKFADRAWFNISPMGFTRIGVGQNSLNLWIADTNFVVSDHVVKTLSQVPGIESIEVLSPYRLRLLIGNAFDEEVVQTEAEITLGVCAPESLLPEEFKSRFDVLREFVAPNRYWGIVVFPNGRLEHAEGDSYRELREQFDCLRTAAYLTGGYFVSSV